MVRSARAIQRSALPRRLVQRAAGHIRPRFVRQPDLHRKRARLPGPRRRGRPHRECHRTPVDHVILCLEQQFAANRAHPGRQQRRPGVVVSDGRSWQYTRAITALPRKHSNSLRRSRCVNTRVTGRWPRNTRPILTRRSSPRAPSSRRGRISSGYTTYDAAVGVKKDAWGVELVGENLTDTRAQLYVNGFDFVHLVTVNRPRTLGLRLAYKF